MSNKEDKLVYDLEKNISDIKEQIPTITEEEIQLIREFYNTVISNAEVDEYDYCKYCSDNHEKIEEMLVNFINKQLEEKGDEVFKNLVHYLVLLNPPKVKRRKRKSNYYWSNYGRFFTVIKKMIAILFDRGLATSNHLIDGQNFMGTMYSSYKWSMRVTYLSRDLLRLAIKHNLNINHQNNNGDTILNIAIKNIAIRSASQHKSKEYYGGFYDDLVHDLLENGFDFSIANDDGLIFIDVLTDMQRINPIKSSSVYERGENYLDSSYKYYYYYEEIIKQLKEKYKDNDVFYTPKAVIQEEINLLDKRIARLNQVLNNSISSENSSIACSMNVRELILVRRKEYQRLYEAVSKKLASIDVAAPIKTLILDLIIEEKIDNNPVNIQVISNILGIYDFNIFIWKFNSNNKDEAIELFISSLNNYIACYLDINEHQRCDRGFCRKFFRNDCGTTAV